MCTKYLLFLHSLLASLTTKYFRCLLLVTCPEINYGNSGPLDYYVVIRLPWCKQSKLHVFGDTVMCMNTWTCFFNLRIIFMLRNTIILVFPFPWSTRKGRAVSVIAVSLRYDLTNQCAQNVDMVVKIPGFVLFSNYYLYVISLKRHGWRRKGQPGIFLLDFLEKSKLKKEDIRTCCILLSLIL
jgi:hypothetical protein